VQSYLHSSVTLIVCVGRGGDVEIVSALSFVLFSRKEREGICSEDIFCLPLLLLYCTGGRIAHGSEFDFRIVHRLGWDEKYEGGV
jgi:hypothetical protein